MDIPIKEPGRLENDLAGSGQNFEKNKKNMFFEMLEYPDFQMFVVDKLMRSEIKDNAQYKRITLFVVIALLIFSILMLFITKFIIQ